jgi:hypothetical protein
MNNQPVLVNGKNYDWTDIQAVIFGLPLVGITEINYKRKRSSKNNYGGGGEPVSYGYGNVEYEGDMSVYVDELVNIRSAAPGTSIIEIPAFSMLIICGGVGTTQFTDSLKNIRITEDPFASKQGDTMIIVKVPFEFAGLYHK